ncbi:hypothetical protein ACFQT0_19640 [Hymenobacter humi]|uniref:Uncharacterized protein n=1 Tax=Hymenobacter humi TaxID=1411620 RepID=A0ABW2UA86_9BACT
MLATEQYAQNERAPLFPLSSRFRMNIKNHNCTVPSMNSAAAIEKLLVEAGATSVSKWYEGQELQGFLFQIRLNGANLVFRLPANVNIVAGRLLQTVKNPDASMRTSLQAQAARTAWRTLHEWVEAQVDMIRLGQVDLLQIFLPYNYSQDQNRSYYDYVKAGAVQLLAA